MQGLTASEWRRKAVHAGMGLLALTLKWLDWKSAAALALGALIFNLFGMPVIGRGIYRDPARARDTGIVAYAAMVLVLVLIFRERYLPIAAAVWAMMAFGDPAATITGRLAGGPALPWNPEKTWTGTLSDWAVGGLAAVLVFAFVMERQPTPAAVAILVSGAAVYALLESIRSGIDDNLVAAIPTALTVFQLGSLAGGSIALWPTGLTGIALFSGLAVNAAVAFGTWQIGLVASSGAVAGAIAGCLVLWWGGWRAYAILWTFFLVGTAATRSGYRRKVRDGIAQAGRGRRSAAHVVANVGVPAALLALSVRPVAFVAALAAALADTLGTELGGLLGRRPFSLLSLARRAIGDAGAVSAPGIAAGVAGAAAIGAVAAATGLIDAAAIPIVTAAGAAGSLAESLLADLGGRRGFRADHDFANAFNTLVGALVALEIALSFETGKVFLPVAGS